MQFFVYSWILQIIGRIGTHNKIALLKTVYNRKFFCFLCDIFIFSSRFQGCHLTEDGGNWKPLSWAHVSKRRIRTRKLKFAVHNVVLFNSVLNYVHQGKSCVTASYPYNAFYFCQCIISKLGLTYCIILFNNLILHFLNYSSISSPFMKIKSPLPSTQERNPWKSYDRSYNQ